MWVCRVERYSSSDEDPDLLRELILDAEEAVVELDTGMLEKDIGEMLARRESCFLGEAAGESLEVSFLLFGKDGFGISDFLRCVFISAWLVCLNEPRPWVFCYLRLLGGSGEAVFNFFLSSFLFLPMVSQTAGAGRRQGVWRHVAK